MFSLRLKRVCVLALPPASYATLQEDGLRTGLPLQRVRVCGGIMATEERLCGRLQIENHFSRDFNVSYWKSLNDT